MTFDEAFDRLIGHEAGYSEDPNDPGNWTGGRVGVGVLKGTKFGIAANSYPDLDIKNLSLDQAKAIYRRDYWDKMGAGELAPAIVFQLFDMAVNSGHVRARMALQRAVEVADDGVFGPITFSAVKARSVSDVLMLFNAERLDFMRRLSNWKYHGSGWAGRIANNLRYAAKDNED